MKTKAGSTKGSCKVLIQRQSNGTYSVGIAVKNVPVQKSKDGNTYVLVDITSELLMSIDCEGIKLKPFMVLKIHKKLKLKQRLKLDAMRGLRYIGNQTDLI